MLSNTSSFPEIGGGAAVYFDPFDTTSLTGALEHLISDDTIRLELIRKGSERLKLFSWEITTNETKNVYNNLLNQ